MDDHGRENIILNSPYETVCIELDVFRTMCLIYPPMLSISVILLDQKFNANDVDIMAFEHCLNSPPQSVFPD